MNTVCMKALRAGVALPPAARHFEGKNFVQRISSGCSIAYGGPVLCKTTCFFNAFRPRVALPPAARQFEKRTFFQCIPEAGGRLVRRGLGGGAPPENVPLGNYFYSGHTFTQYDVCM